MYYVTIPFHYFFKKQSSHFFKTVFCSIFKAAQNTFIILVKKRFFKVANNTNLVTQFVFSV